MGWLIALGILAALALLPIGVSLRYNEDGFFLYCLLGWIPISLNRKKASSKGKTEKKSRKSEKKKEKPVPEEKKKGGAVSDFLPFIRIVLDFLNDFRKKLRVRRLEAKLTMAADDPCDLAINYGRAWAAVGNLMPQLERWLVIQKRNIEMACDFEASQTTVKVRADLVVSLGGLLWITARCALRALKQFIKLQKSKKGGVPNE